MPLLSAPISADGIAHQLQDTNIPLMHPDHLPSRHQHIMAPDEPKPRSTAMQEKNAMKNPVEGIQTAPLVPNIRHGHGIDRPNHHHGLTREEASCLKTALALVVIKNRYQERTNKMLVEGNNSIVHANPFLSMLMVPRPKEQDESVIPTSSLEPTQTVGNVMKKCRLNDSFKQTDQQCIRRLPCEISGWSNRLRHLMQLALHFYHQEQQTNQVSIESTNHSAATEESTHTKREPLSTSSATGRLNALCLHIACQLEQLYEQFEHADTSKDDDEETVQIPINRNPTVVAPPNVVDQTIQANNSNEPEQLGEKNQDMKGKLQPVFLFKEWVRRHLIVHSNETKKQGDLQGNRSHNILCSDYEYNPTILFYPVWERILTRRPLSMSVLLIPILVNLILPHALRHKFWDNEKGRADVQVLPEWDESSCYYWLQLLQQAVIAIKSVDEKSDATQTVVQETLRELLQAIAPIQNVTDLAYLFYNSTTKAAEGKIATRRKNDHVICHSNIGMSLLLEYGLSNILQHLMT